MGIIVEDEIKLKSGIPITNSYASFGCSDAQIIKIKEDTYQISSTAKYWKDVQARLDDLQVIHKKSLNVVCKLEEIENGNIYKLLYEELTKLHSKSNYI
tara:strand:- start:845 stop:1141 length:297 start_codon:yes stop_codon:yes gene_type:complete